MCRDDLRTGLALKQWVKNVLKTYTPLRFCFGSFLVTVSFGRWFWYLFFITQPSKKLLAHDRVTTLKRRIRFIGRCPSLWCLVIAVLHEYDGYRSMYLISRFILLAKKTGIVVQWRGEWIDRYLFHSRLDLSVITEINVQKVIFCAVSEV